MDAAVPAETDAEAAALQDVPGSARVPAEAGAAMPASRHVLTARLPAAAPVIRGVPPDVREPAAITVPAGAVPAVRGVRMGALPDAAAGAVAVIRAVKGAARVPARVTVTMTATGHVLRSVMAAQTGAVIPAVPAAITVLPAGITAGVPVPRDAALVADVPDVADARGAAAVPIPVLPAPGSVPDVLPARGSVRQTVPAAAVRGAADVPGAAADAARDVRTAAVQSVQGTVLETVPGSYLVRQKICNCKRRIRRGRALPLRKRRDYEDILHGDTGGYMQLPAEA